MSLDLDARQRAMLEEMHVHVWWPESGEGAVSAAAPVAAPGPVRAAPKNIAEAMAAAPELAAAHASTPPATTIVARASAGDIEGMDWPALQQAVAGCVACALSKSRKNTVFGVGPAAPADGRPPQADWLIIGEAPGENEDIQGEPFVGQAGKLLDNMLKAIGVSRHGAEDGQPHKAACIVNVLKCRPPGNRNPAPEEVAQCAPYLRRQVELLQPKVIIAMGRFAVQSLLQDTVPDVVATPLGRLRGKVHQYHGVPVVVTYHPAYLLRSLPEKAKAWADLCLAMDVWKKRKAAETAQLAVQAEIG
ncbi:uracil-DNA glycosylase [Rhodoferax koreense]|uniref:Type-4 uracil-DNA glycosylase n=1 Tax=Rhodoferax koreensis TaxID=1842727 RepID=A0A1P8K2K3_9BURK|nr:uracil-DNA glycosylase [Rhodoferax koreense]APW40216.1 uracil-DNA glycosylase [Rhodoferax koreense]